VVSTGAPTNFSFGYDLNGNMTSGRGATIDWTSYNYPSCIRLGAACTGSSSDYSSFSYTPDRQYWRQISNYVSGGTATTLYIGGLLEKVTTSSGTDYRHYIRAGGSTIIVSRQSTGTNSINYVTSDHLGSSSAITNSSGGILVNSSFDAFGKRRGSNWTGSPSAGDWTAIASTTRRGFTEHSMLDNLNLTHMNGRVYDQVIGRFLSADPYIDGALNTQGWNRFSYVQNNPLSYTDPSGFAVAAPYIDGFWIIYGGDGAGWGGDFTQWSDAAVERAAMSAGGNAIDHEYGGPTGTWVPDFSKDTASWSACVRPDLATNAAWPNGEFRAPDSSAALLVVHGVLGVTAASEWPLVSQVAGGLDAGVSLIEGDPVGAGLSVAGMVPGAVAADVTKLGRLGAKAAQQGTKAVERVRGPAFDALKDHAGRHSMLHPNAYYNAAVKHLETGTKFTFRHEGQFKNAFITRTGADSFTFTSASRNGDRIFTHIDDVSEQYLRNIGITLPKGF
jgi:RHS repeat-associated protein